MLILKENGKLETLSLKVESRKEKVEYEFQDLCLELQPIYGKVVWSLPYKYSEAKIRQAAKIAKQNNKQTFAYLVGILKKLR